LALYLLVVIGWGYWRIVKTSLSIIYESGIETSHWEIFVEELIEMLLDYTS